MEKDRLAVFDIDGTLIKHLPAGNDRCYVRAFREVFGITGIADNHDAWASFKTSTDSGITREIYRKRFDRDPSAEEIARFKAREMELLDAEFAYGGLRYEMNGGTAAMVGGLRGRSSWDMAVATGNWERKGRLKLASAGVPHEGIPFGGAEDGEERTEIVLAAAGRARKARGGGDYRRTVFVGDRPWDVDAAARLRIPFVGIGAGDDERTLRAAGAGTVLPDFTDLDAFLRALEG